MDEDAIEARSLRAYDGGMYGGDTFGGPIDVVMADKYIIVGLAGPLRFFANRRFADCATAWEKAWSSVINSRRLDPVLDGTGLIIGHYGWVTGGDILAPKMAQVFVGSGNVILNDVLQRGVPLIIVQQSSGRDRDMQPLA